MERDAGPVADPPERPDDGNVDGTPVGGRPGDGVGGVGAEEAPQGDAALAQRGSVIGIAALLSVAVIVGSDMPPNNFTGLLWLACAALLRTRWEGRKRPRRMLTDAMLGIGMGVIAGSSVFDY